MSADLILNLPTGTRETSPLDDGGFRDLIERAGNQGAVRIASPPPPKHATLAPELKAYFNERRRALITELTALDLLLGRTTTK